MIFIILNKKPEIKWNLILGIMIGILFLFKYNLLLVLIPSVLLFWYFQSDNKKITFLAKYLFWQGLGLILPIFLVSLIFIKQGVWDGFVNVFSFSAFYSSMPALDSSLLKHFIKTGSIIFADNFSLLYIVLIIASTIYLSKNLHKSENEGKFFQVLGVIGLTLLVTVFIERKLYNYHFTRFLLIASIFASVGSVYLFEILKENYRSFNKPGRFIIIFMIAGIVAFSPISRWVYSLRMPFYYITDTLKYDQLFEKSDESANTRVQMKTIVQFIKSNAQTKDTVINISTGANLINLMLCDYNTSAFEQSCFYLGVLKIPQWQQQIKNEISNAKWLVVQNNDRHLWINGHNMPSWESMKKDSVLSDILNRKFHTVFDTENFYVLKRNF
jgi:4-amino-4-deoxy-L-arabinose transferase-like glycosyltransferase